MLVLTRKLQDQIRIGDNITITILRVKGNTVRIGVDAPRNVRVMRGELPEFDPPADAALTVELNTEEVAAPAGEVDEVAPSEEQDCAPLTAVVRARRHVGRAGKARFAELASV